MAGREDLSRYIKPRVAGMHRAILTKLLADHFVTSAGLIEHLWTPFNEPADPAATLRVTIGTLRPRLRAPWEIRTTGGGYLLHPYPPPWPVAGRISEQQRVLIEAMMDGRCHSTQYLAEAVYGGVPPPDGAQHTVRTVICYLRHRLGPGWSITNIPGRGYLLAKDEEKPDVRETERHDLADATRPAFRGGGHEHPEA